MHSPGTQITLRDARGVNVSVTAGKIDRNAQHLYSNGQCVAFARELAAHMGWGVAVMTYSEQGLVAHAWALAADGMYWDIYGEHDPQALTEDLDEDDQIDTYNHNELMYVHPDTCESIGTQDYRLARLFVNTFVRQQQLG